MKAELTITPESNVDYDQGKVNDLGQVHRVTRDWSDIVPVYNTHAKEAGGALPCLETATDP